MLDFIQFVERCVLQYAPERRIGHEYLGVAAINGQHGLSVRDVAVARYEFRDPDAAHLVGCSFPRVGIANVGFDLPGIELGIGTEGDRRVFGDLPAHVAALGVPLDLHLRITHSGRGERAFVQPAEAERRPVSQFRILEPAVKGVQVQCGRIGDVEVEVENSADAFALDLVQPGLKFLEEVHAVIGNVPIVGFGIVGLKLAVVPTDGTRDPEAPAAFQLENIAAGKGRLGAPVIANLIVGLLHSRLGIRALAAERA